MLLYDGKCIEIMSETAQSIGSDRLLITIIRIIYFNQTARDFLGFEGVQGSFFFLFMSLGAGVFSESCE